jgi:hypothetical protein
MLDQISERLSDRKKSRPFVRGSKAAAKNAKADIPLLSLANYLDFLFADVT